MNDIIAREDAVKSAAAQALLPRDRPYYRPLMIVLAIMAFLAALALLSSRMSARTMNIWQSDLRSAMTIQLFPDAETDRATMIALAETTLQDLPQAAQFDIAVMSESDARDLLRPWLGDVALPDDLPLPVLISIDGKGDGLPDAEALRAPLSQAGLNVEIDDHREMASRLRRVSVSLQTTIGVILFLVLAASLGAAGFATHSAMAANQKVIRVLTQVGARDRFTARIFTQRFFTIGLQSGAIGALAALIFMLILTTLSRWGIGQNNNQGDGLLPLLRLEFMDSAYLIILAFGFGAISALAALYSSLDYLRAETSMDAGRR